MAGWLLIPDTPVDYPVLQTANNTDYLYHDFSGRYSLYGSLFLDYESDLQSGRNLIIYGHNMKDQLMFGSLSNYREQAYGLAHPVLYLQHNDGAAYAYQLMSVLVLPAYPDARTANRDYRQIDFDDAAQFADWLGYWRDESLYAFALTLDLAEVTQVVTLSTCVYDFNNARLVVMAVR